MSKRGPTTTAVVARDGGRGYRARVARIEQPRDEEQLRRVLSDARREGRRICLRGAGKSQGGLTLDEDAVIVDTGRLNRILEIDVAARTARVQAGVTWDRLRAALDPHGLSTRTTQSYGVFTVGGSVSVNAHGRNVDTGVLAETVLSMRVMLADGQLVEASRDLEPELFGLVLGGLGLFGVLLDVTLRLVPNDLYLKTRVAVMPTTEYPAYFADHVHADPEAHFHYARLSVLESEVWERLFCLDFRRQDDDGTPDPVRPDVVTRMDLAKLRLLLWATRHVEWSRRNRFGLELIFRARPERARRNNVGNEPWALLSTGGSRWADWLQEFFIPTGNFLRFVERASQLLRAENTRLLNTTIRFVPRNVDAFLSYARQDCFSVVTYHQQRLDPEAIARAGALFRQLLDCAIDCGGTYYLCYHRFAEPAQLRRAYPRIDEFFALKRKYDPDELFTNQFYGEYGTDRQRGQMHLTQWRPLRLPPARIFSVLTADGVDLRLQRLRGGDRGPVVLAPGYAMSARVFTLDTLEPSLAEYLCGRGFDVWLLSWRSSPDVDASRSRFTLDDVARLDWPAAIEFVLAETGASEVDCVVHCLGAQTLLMSLASKQLTAGVRSAVCLQVGLFYDMPARRRLMCRLGLPQFMARSGLPYLDVSAQQASGLAYRVLDTVLRAYPVSARERCSNRTCRRTAFLYGELVSHVNLTAATHEQMGAVLGSASMGPFGQLARSTLRGRILRADGADVYFDDLQGLRIPITVIHGSDNATVLAGSTAATYELLCEAHGADQYRRHVVAGYGHLDCLIGKHAGQDVFPLIAEHLDRTEKGAMNHVDVGTSHGE